MKLYKIGKISKLYNISTDLLRYYEKEGLIKPQEIKENGYRYYSARQIWKLNTIRGLRNLGVSLGEIKIYIEERSTKKSLELVEFQLGVIDEKLYELLKLKKQLNSKKIYLHKVLENKKYGKITEIILPERRCYKKYHDIDTDWEIDLELKKLTNSIDSDEGEYFAGSRGGAILEVDDYNKKEYNLYKGTFLMDSSGESRLKEGRYISLTFKGSYKGKDIHYKNIKKYMDKNDLEIDGEILEIYKIDIHETDNEDEFITEIQMKIKD
jgi:DNA-binding transcriptional MerR regulator